MNKKLITLAAATVIATLAPGLASAGEIDELKQAMKQMQDRLAQLETQQKEAPRPAATAPVLSAGSLGANANVTLYGKLDLFAEVNGGGGKGDRVALESGGLNGSRLGVKGGADISDGLRAVFQLEAGFFANKGTLAQGGRFFGRQAYAGLEGKWGRLTAGRQYSPLYNSVISFDPYEQGYGSPTTDGNVSTGSTRFDSSIVYATPKYAGLSGNVMVAFGGETGKSHNVGAVSVNYENGKLLTIGTPRFRAGPIPGFPVWLNGDCAPRYARYSHTIEIGFRPTLIFPKNRRPEIGPSFNPRIGR